jgi:hypothetical protein
MPTQLSELRGDVLVHCPKASEILVDGMLADAARTFYRESKIKRVALAAIDMVAAQAEYALPNPAGFQIADVRWATCRGSPLNPVSEEELDMQWAERRAGHTYTAYHSHQYEGLTDTDWRAATSDQPYSYYCPEPNVARLVGVPSASVTGALLFNVSIYPIDPTEVDDWVFNEWQDAIVAKALESLFLMPAKPWMSGNLATFYADSYEGLKTEAHARANRGNRRNDRPLRTTSYAR